VFLPDQLVRRRVVVAPSRYEEATHVLEGVVAKLTKM
jgi:hypothetical protein